MTEEPLDADAIYAALRWAKNNANRAEISAEHVLAERNRGPGEVIQHPPFNLTPEEIEAIFPGYPGSVLTGLDLATVVLVSPSTATTMAKSEGPIGLAVRKFIAEDK